MTAGLIVLLVALFALGVPLFAVLGTATALSYYLFSPEYVTVEKQAFIVAQQMFGILNKDTLLAIPFFVLAGLIMTEGSISRKLVNVAKAFVGWIPGGLAIAGVMACMIFAAICGSSAATVVAIGMVMQPALVAAKYPSRFSTGLLSSAGSLGILIPPSIPMIVYAIMVPGVSVGKMFLAGILPGILIGCVFMLYSVVIGVQRKIPTTPFSGREAIAALRDGFFGLMLPVIILGGIYSGLMTVNESAAIGVAYALFVEVVIHREIKLGQIPGLLVRSATEMGAILLIVSVAAALSYFLTLQQVPDMIAEFLSTKIESKAEFLLVVNIILLITGALMDIISAILILAPIIAAVGAQYGVDPIHLGIIFIVNLEIGYLTPPVGLNLFVASTIFKLEFIEVVRGVIPFIILMILSLLLISYIPSISLFLVS